MVTIQEAKQSIETKRGQLEQARTQIKKAKESIPKTTQRQLRGQRSQGGLAGRQLQRKLASAREQTEEQLKQIEGYKGQVEVYEKEVEKYLQTPGGRLQYAKEKGVSPKKIYGKIGAGYAEEVMGLEYDTPYGNVTDWTPKYEALQREGEFVESLTKEEQTTYFAPEIEKGLTSAGIDYSRDDSGQLALENIPDQLKEVKFSTLFGGGSVLIDRPKTQQQKLDNQSVSGVTSYQDIDLKEINKYDTDMQVKGITSSAIFPMVNASSGEVPKEKDSALKRTLDYLRGGKQETYVSSIGTGGAFVSGSMGVPEISKSTLSMRPPTMEEKARIEQVKIKEMKILGAPAKFAAGGFEWQKKLLPPPTKDVPSPLELAKIEQQTSYSELLKKGDLPAVTRKLFYSAGETQERYVSSPIKSNLFGIETTRAQEREIGRKVGTIYLFSAFAPMMKTGTQARLESEFVYDTIKKRFVRRGDLEDYLKYKKTGNVIRDKTFTEKLDDVTTLMNKLRNAPPETQLKLSKDLRLLLEQTYGKQELTGLLKEYSAQNLGIVQQTPTATQVSKDLIKETFEMVGITPEMGQVGLLGAGVSSFAGKGTYEKTEQVSNLLTGSSIFPVVSAKDTQIGILDSKTSQVQKTKQDTSQRSLLGLRLDTKQIQRQQQPQKQIQKSALALVSLLGMKTKQVSKQKYIQRPKTTQITKPRLPTKPTPPTKPVPIYFDGDTPVEEKKLSAKETIEGIFKVFARKEGVDVEIGKARTEEEAFSLLGKRLKSTLRASGFVERGGKKVKPISFDSGFRISKVSPFRIVERKEKRLRKKTTGKQIQTFRKSKRSKRWL